jgi:anhydro-N-acetylmuramic acid kinase
MASDLYIGLMSGTSLDGIDAALANFDSPQVVVASRFAPFEPSLRADLAALLQPGADEIHRGAVAANRLSMAYAQSVVALLSDAGLSPKRIAAIGCHGQTVRHDPAAGYTVQIGNGALLAELARIPVVTDFRSRDIAAGGEGAPLVPAFHARYFGTIGTARAIVNIGGIANITYLPATGEVLGFDCGPGNTLMDQWIGEHRGERFDAEGAWASGGQVIPSLLVQLKSAPYFTRTPPKSTGRELFNLPWLRLAIGSELAAVDVQSTLCQFTVETVADAIERDCPHTTEVYVCGGGAANGELMRRLRARLRPISVATTAALGIDPDWVEAIAFAWLARETLSGRPGNLPAVTGASGHRILGCIYPA